MKTLFDQSVKYPPASHKNDPITSFKAEESLEDARLIPLTKGKFAIVDKHNFEWLSKWKWHCTVDKRGKCYATRRFNINGKWISIRMHRLILNTPANFQIDHHNHNTLDNRENNLRIATQSQNQGNRVKQKSSSKYKGVTWYKDTKKWKAQIAIKNHKTSLGYFNDEIEAAKAYDMKAKEVFGDFAKTNF